MLAHRRRSVTPGLTSVGRLGLVHDHLAQRGGAERVALSLGRHFAPTPLVTSVFVRGLTYPEFEDLPVAPMFPDRLPWVRRDPRRALPFMRSAFQGLDFVNADVILCSSSGWSHIVTSRAPKVVYCHNPPRWLYQRESYLGRHGWAADKATALYFGRLTRVDRTAAREASLYLANSTAVRDRVRAAYGLEAAVLPPPVSFSPAGPERAVPGVSPGFLLTIGRARAYKNTRQVCEVIEGRPWQPLVVVGGDTAVTGSSPAKHIKRLARVDDPTLRWLYRNCAALVTLAEEDFGLTPLEANAFARPAVVLRAGGFLDTVVHGRTGLFVDGPESLAMALDRAGQIHWDEKILQQHAARYGEERFLRRIEEALVCARDGRRLPWTYDPTTFDREIHS